MFALLACVAGPQLDDVADPHGVEVTLAAPGEVTCTSGDDTRSTHVNHVGTVRGLLADTEYGCRVTYDEGGESAEVTWRTEPLPGAFPEVTLVVEDPDAGHHLVNLDGPAEKWLAILDAEGRARWQYEGASGTDGVDATYRDGRITWCGDDIAEIDLDGRTLWFPTWTSASPTEVPRSWHHDGAPTEDGTALLTLTHELLDTDETAPVQGFVVRQIPRTDQGVAWSWSVGVDGAEDFPVTTEDPFHANAVSEVEGGYLVGLRDLEQVVKLAEDGTLAWRLGDGGDFTLLEADGSVAETSRWFGPHHDAKLADGHLVLFDNGHVGRGSRVMVLDLDEEARTARIGFEWQPDADWYNGFWGGADELPDGQVSVAFGENTEDGPRSGLYHVDPDGTVRWQLLFPQAVGVYRSQWLERW